MNTLDRLAEKNSNGLVIAWALATMVLSLAIVGMGAIAIWTLNWIPAILTALLFGLFWVPTGILIAVSIRQNKNFTANLEGDNR